MSGIKKYVSEESLTEITQDILTQAKESGEFDGYTPQKGYVS